MKLHIKKDKVFSVTVLIYVFATLFVDIFRKIGYFEQELEMIRNSIYIICFIIVIIHMILEKECKLDILFVLFVFPMQAFLTLLITPKIIPVFDFFILYFFSRDFVGYYLFSRLKNQAVFKDNTFLIIIIMLGYSMMITQIGFSNSSYMLSSYNLIVPTSVILAYGIKKFQMTYLLGGLLSLLIILMYGARGALVCVGISMIFFVYRFIFKSKTFIRKLLFFSVGGASSLYVMFSYNKILYYIYNITNSRTIKLILTGEIMNGHGRQEIYDAFKYAIIKNPFKYRGILADRVLAAQVMRQPISRGTYAHNIIWEILYQYGVILGTGILIFIISVLGICLYKVSKENNDDVYIMFMSIFPVGFCSLFFSGSYLNTHYFWMLFGMSYNILKNFFQKNK